MTETDTDAALENIALRTEAEEKTIKQYAEARNRLGIVSLSGVQQENVTWLWDARIAVGKVAIIEGDPGIGKSTLTLAIATAVTLGRGLPGQPITEPGRVLLVPAEDGIADTVQPRLSKLGADLSLIDAIERPLTLDKEGCTLIHNYMVGSKPSLCIIDPLFSFVGNKDTNKQGDARGIMDKLTRLAKHHNCAIVCIRHLNKGNKDKSIYRGGGSIDFTAAARSVLLVGADPADIRQRAIVQIKNNLAPLADPIGFSLDRGVFAWTGKSDLTAEQILANEREAIEEAGALQDAIEFLKEILALNPVTQKQIMNEARQAGIAERTLNRAKARLAIKSRKRIGDGNWIWEL